MSNLSAPRSSGGEDEGTRHLLAYTAPGACDLITTWESYRDRKAYTEIDIAYKVAVPPAGACVGKVSWGKSLE